tara:strand:+ start:1116 stop:1352 length:237 start_codon:yes stop_codon:yes gene_type:complete
MGKMKQIAMLIANNDADVLNRLIKISEKANRGEVSFIGKTYSLHDARQILLYMYDEQTKYNKVHRDNKSIESDLSSND